MTHAELLEKIRAECRKLRLLAFHSDDPRRDWSAGFPDVLVCGRGGLLAAEVKVGEDVLSPDQRRWGWTLKAAGIPFVVWRPEHWAGGVIQQRLAALTKPQS